MKKCKSFIFFVLLISFFNCFAQDNVDNNFIKYLSKENKKIELYSYLQNLSIDSLTKNYLKAKYYLQYKNDTAFLFHFNKSKNIFLKDTNAVGFAACQLLQNNNSDITQAFFANIDKNNNINIKKVISIYALNKSKPKDINENLYPDVLQQSIVAYKVAASKNAIKAAMLSALIPGAGKMYIGKFRIGVNALVINSLFAYQTYESINKLGIKHPLSIVNLVFTSLFYASNIYGSYRDTKYFRKENLNQLYQDASNYYALDCFPTLYK